MRVIMEEGEDREDQGERVVREQIRNRRGTARLERGDEGGKEGCSD
jgi:hypothetical protein